MILHDASPAQARAQGAWIAAMDPWRSLGYDGRRLGAWLGRIAGAGTHRVLRAVEGRRVIGVIVVQSGVLLGDFIALLAVRPEASGRGVGRALVAEVEARTFATRRWLYVSFDADNRGAARFYRRLGFTRVGRLPDLVAPGHVEVLLRKGRPPTV